MLHRLIKNKNRTAQIKLLQGHWTIASHLPNILKEVYATRTELDNGKGS